MSRSDESQKKYNQRWFWETSPQERKRLLESGRIGWPHAGPLGCLALLLMAVAGILYFIFSDETSDAEKTIADRRIPKCVELILEKGEMNKTQAVDYCNDYYRDR